MCDILANIWFHQHSKKGLISFSQSDEDGENSLDETKNRIRKMVGDVVRRDISIFLKLHKTLSQNYIANN
jgi:hypothetical protein